MLVPQFPAESTLRSLLAKDPVLLRGEDGAPLGVRLDGLRRGLGVSHGCRLQLECGAMMTRPAAPRGVARIERSVDSRPANGLSRPSAPHVWLRQPARRRRYCQMMLSRTGCMAAMATSKSVAIGTSIMIMSRAGSLASKTISRTFSPGPRL